MASPLIRAREPRGVVVRPDGKGALEFVTGAAAAFPVGA